MGKLNRLKIALVCDWLTNMGGAEKVILGLHQLFPDAPIYTSLYNPAKVQGFEKADIRTSSLQKIPFAKNKHQMFLSFMPRAFERFNLDEYDIVISSSHSCAKGVITRPETLHVSYCHSPMRYAWENGIRYIQEYDISPFIKKVAPFLIHKIRLWDRVSAERVDAFVTNSHYVQKRIWKYYRKPSTVIHPFIKTEEFSVGTERQKFFLAAGRLTAYKRFDLIIETFNKLGLPLKIAGTGASEKKLREMAKENIEFLGYVSDQKLHELYQEAQAFIFPQIEDFGIMPLEAMASGCPVIAYAKGGATETVVDGKTGILMQEQTVEELGKAIQKLQNKRFNHKEIRKHSENFSEEMFKNTLLNYIEKKWEHFNTTNS